MDDNNIPEKYPSPEFEDSDNSENHSRFFQPKSKPERKPPVKQTNQTNPPENHKSETIPSENQTSQEHPPQSQTPDIAPDKQATQQQSSYAPESKPVSSLTPNHVLAPKKYKLKAFLMFSDIFLLILFLYFVTIKSFVQDITNENFSSLSGRAFSYYCVLAITIAVVVILLIFKTTKSITTRFQRDNQVRQNPNIKVWLTGFDWGWPVLFIPTMLLMLAVGLLGVLLDLILPDSNTLSSIQTVIGGLVILFGAVNAAVVIFKLKPVTLGLLLGGFLILLLILLLHGPNTFLAFFRSFRHLGVKIEPLGYILLAYIWFVFLRIIWLKSLFFYWVFLPNRLELQHGLSESNDSVDRDDLRHKIDTDDVILRWFNVGIITFYFPDLDRLPITNVVWGIRKKATYANRIASVKTMQD